MNDKIKVAVLKNVHKAWIMLNSTNCIPKLDASLVKL